MPEHRCESIRAADLPPCPGCNQPPVVGCYKMVECKMAVGCGNCGPMFNESSGEGGAHYSKDALADWKDHTERCTKAVFIAATGVERRIACRCLDESPSGARCGLLIHHAGPHRGRRLAPVAPEEEWVSGSRTLRLTRQDFWIELCKAATSGDGSWSWGRVADRAAELCGVRFASNRQP